MTGGEKHVSRELIQAFDRQFARVHARSCALAGATPVELLYQSTGTTPAASVGEQLLRSAAAVERTFGGITANLWDDPFEWTLPENLSTIARVHDYLAEVEATRSRAFARFAEDADLLKEVLVPAGNTTPLVVLLTETLVKAADYQGRAIATLSLISKARLPRFED
jgi:hypothetical protein